MTKKDFIAIAATLDANLASQAIVLDFADMLGEQNPRFDRARFVEAATINLRAIRESQARILASEME